MSASWPICERCGSPTNHVYVVTVQDPTAPTGWTVVKLCKTHGELAGRIPLGARTREAALAA